MADLDNGYTRLANEILDKMAKTKLSPTQYRILFVIWRYTYGFQRKTHELSLSFLSSATGCDSRSVQRELKKLISMNIVTVSYEKQKRVLGFNKHLEEWQGIVETANGNSANGENTNGEITNETIGETARGTIGETANQERNNKENIKENTSSTKDAALEFMNEIGRYYTSLTGRFPSPKDEVAITELAEHTQDIQTVKDIMKDISDRYKPVRKGDKIKSFTYFVPGIKDKLFVEQKKKEVKPSGEAGGHSDDPYAGIGLSL